ncbi:hypothetical protein BD309DRAFT_876084 [Dichomitus squalens]|nr:hypothetical protein BD309DRAFT_876084 [Dichomitus squalens]
MRVEEVEVWITCDGHQLAEFGAEPSRSSPRTLACYIPSEAGKTFAFNWKSTMTLPSGVYLRYDFTIDGSSAGAQWSYQWEKPGSRWGVRTCLTLRRPFTFAPLTTTGKFADRSCGLETCLRWPTPRQMTMLYATIRRPWIWEPYKCEYGAAEASPSQTLQAQQNILHSLLQV